MSEKVQALHGFVHSSLGRALAFESVAAVVPYHSLRRSVHELIERSHEPGRVAARFGTVDIVVRLLARRQTTIRHRIGIRPEIDREGFGTSALPRASAFS